MQVYDSRYRNEVNSPSNSSVINLGYDWVKNLIKQL